VLTVTRQAIMAQHNAPWLQTIDDESREHSRLLGRRLLALTSQYITNEANEQVIVEAQALGLEYGRHCLQIKIPLLAALQASMFFRDTMIETALQLPENVNIRPETNVRLLRRINTILNVVHLAIAEVYDDSHHNLPGP
jgi:hypothetical protein